MDGYKKVDEVANALGIAASTVKKYYLLIEERGYRFKRSAQGKVMFSVYDISLFHKLIKKKNEPGMTLLKAVDLLLKEIDLNDTADIGCQAATLMAELTDLKQLIQQQNEIMTVMQAKLNKMEERYDLLMEPIRETKDIKKLKLLLGGSRRFTVEF